MWDPFCAALSTLLGPRTRITHGLPTDALQVPALLDVVALVYTWLYIYKERRDCSCAVEKFRSYCPYYSIIIHLIGN